MHRTNISDILAASQIIENNPILKESEEMKKLYFAYLEKYIRIGKWKNRKYVRAQLTLYASILTGTETIDARTLRNLKGDIGKYKYLLIFDLLSILGYEKEKLFSSHIDFNNILSSSFTRNTVSTKQIEMVKYNLFQDFKMNKKEQKAINAVLDVVNTKDSWVKIKNNPIFKSFGDYIELVKQNIEFIYTKPYKIMLTANMSAGKSTFLNAITGLNISLTQNMACTSKIHSIIGKPYADGFSYEYDHELVMDAQKEELLEDNDLNAQDKILVSTYFNGNLGGARLIFNDSPGVNNSQNDEHKEITNRLLKAKNYDALIYIMNATQLGTVDDEQHLEFVKSQLGRRDILFVINKIDTLNVEEENVENIILKQKEYLKEKGFSNPKICPVSSYAAYLAKKCQREEINRVERRELNNFIDKFLEMKLEDYYKTHFPDIEIQDDEIEEKQLLKTCGISYVEEIIDAMSKGGK